MGKEKAYASSLTVPLNVVVMWSISQNSWVQQMPPDVQGALAIIVGSIVAFAAVYVVKNTPQLLESAVHTETSTETPESSTQESRQETKTQVAVQ